MDLLRTITAIPERLEALKALADTGLLKPDRPDRLVGFALAIARWGVTPAAGYAGAAVRFPNRPAIIDDQGAISFGEVHRRTNALAVSLGERGIGAGDSVAILCRNHRGLIEATVAASKVGADVLFLNTGFAARQLREVLDREGASCIVYDADFAEVVMAGGGDRPRFVAWHEGHTPDPTLDDLIEEGSSDDLTPPSKQGRIVILTSGTTGTPKGATRGTPRSLDAAVALFSRIPLKVGERTVIAAPMFHAWGLAHLSIAIAMSSTVIVTRRFDPEAILRLVDEHDATVLAVVPVMLQRILRLGDDVIRRHDTSSLRIVAASGSALPGELATRWMDTFGDNLYNLYGSTEVAWASIATPRDLRAAPGTAGRVPLGTTVRILGDDDKPVPAGTTGRIFVGSDLQFEGYTGGGSKEVVAGLMSSGDVGHFDDSGLLFVEGREDDMIVSGGENVYPSEVEDLLAQHDAVDEVAVVGVPDDEFGQRLKAFVVLHDGASVSEQDLRAHVKSELASYKVPKEIEILDELPRNHAGKVLKRELRERDA
jgi:fatty-acyl-CoA synthase